MALPRPLLGLKERPACPLVLPVRLDHILMEDMGGIGVAVGAAEEGLHRPEGLLGLLEGDVGGEGGCELVVGHGDGPFSDPHRLSLLVIQ